jgi:hypothetical protein
MFQYTRGEDWGCGEAIITLVLKGDPGNQYVDEQPTEDIKDYYKKAGQQAKDEVEILVIHFKEYQREAPTATAALIGDEAALGSLLHSSRRSDHEELMWEYSALGEPIAAAAYAGSVNIIRNALKDLTEKELRLDCRPANYLMEVVDIALDQGHIHAATEFLNLGTDYFYVLEKEMFVRWLAKIVNSGDAAAISALLELTHKAGTGICVQAYETACRLGHVYVAELFIKKNVLKPNQLYVYCGMYSLCLLKVPFLRSSQFANLYPYSEDSYPIQRALLLMADGRSCAQLIKKLIHLGADPDGPRVLRKDLHCSPLFMAVEKRKWAAVAVLLNHGANLDLPAFTHVFLGIKIDTLTSIQRHFEHGRKHLLPARVWSELARLLPRRTTGQLRPAVS